jgi:Uma2 family endonuclease
MNMAESLKHELEAPLEPDISHLILDDDTPVDSLYSERLMRFLPTCLFDSWQHGKPFIALSDVGLFSTPSNETVIVPDFMLALGVEQLPLTGDKKTRSYFTWVYGKSPDLVVEIVSNKIGGELDAKFEKYQRLGVAYYAVHDPGQFLGQRELRLFQLVGGRYVEMADPCTMPELGLRFTFWEGTYQDVEARWLRFEDEQGDLLLTGSERAELERLKAKEAEAEAKEAKAEAKEAKAEAKEAKARAAELEQKLRELGLEP